MKASSKSKKKRRNSSYWSADVTKHSNALDLKHGVFSSTSPRAIAASLKRSAESSTRRKSTPYRSAMSMLNFYVNRAGNTLSARQKSVLNHAKTELRRLFGKK